MLAALVLTSLGYRLSSDIETQSVSDGLSLTPAQDCNPQEPAGPCQTVEPVVTKSPTLSGLSDFEHIQGPSTDPEPLGDLDPASGSATDVGSATANDNGAFVADVTLDSRMLVIRYVKSLVATCDNGSLAATALLVVETPVTSPIKTWAVPVDRGSKHELEMIGVRNPLQSAKRATLS